MRSPFVLTSFPDIADRLMPRSLQELLRALTELLHFGREAVAGLKRPRGLYEVLRYKTSLELLDVRGRRAVYLRHERLRFLRDGVTSFYEYSWGSGETLASHRVRPGRIAERRQIGQRYRSLVVLPAPQNKGDELTFQVRRLIRKGQWGKRNWLEAEVNQEMHRLELCVILPASRRVRAARLVRHREQAEGPVPVKTALQGKQHLRATVIRPVLGGLYTLEWDW